MKKLETGILLALLGAVASTQAQESSSGPTVNVTGFGSLTLTRADTSDAEFARPNQLNGVQSSPRLGPDSNFAVQGTAKFNDMFSATAQGLVRKNATDYFGAELAWAFMKAKINDEFAVRVGRIGLPVYMISDYRNVGYANTMIRPPIEMYRQVPIESLDGLDLLYAHSFGDNTVTTQFAVGRTRTDNASTAGVYHVTFSPITALNLVWEHGPYTFRFGRTDATFESDLPSLSGLVNVLNSFGLTQAANEIKVKDTKGSFTSVGFMMDQSNVVIQAEYAKRKTDSRAVADTTSWYTMFGYRFGKVLPYFTHAYARQDSPRSVDGIPPIPQLAPLAAGANYFASLSPDQTGNSIGVRWDFHKSAALKFQIDRYSPSNGPGTFVNAKPTFTGPVTVMALGVDYVF